MIIFGWGRVTKKFIGEVFQRTCQYCNTTSTWQLCIVRTWFTLFFIPVIPYKTTYCVACPNCGSYVKLTQEQFEKMKFEIKNSRSSGVGMNTNSVEDSLKYQGKTETQINFLKQMEEHRKQTANN